MVGATSEARRIVQEAEAEAQRIIEEAQEHATETHQRGYEEGRQEGLAQHTQELSQALLRVRNIEEGLEAEYIGLVRECVERILSQELKLHPDAIVGIVRGALQDARQQREIIVRVNPADMDALQKNQGRLLEVLARANAVELREDATVSRGGCVVFTELGTIDGTLERQLEAMSQAIQAELSEGAAAGPYQQDDELDPEDDPGYGGYA